MKTEFHPANQRGHANHGWLDTWHSFSFATYFNPVRERFGCLRVLNDDFVAAGTGFDLHPHNNMEIITIMLEGILEHRDSMGNTQVIKPGEVQVMSAGTGIYHAEYNHSDSEGLQLFQIWIFPRQKGLTPRYDQKSFPGLLSDTKMQVLVTPDHAQNDQSLWIHQDAYLTLYNLSKDESQHYKANKEGNVFFVMVIEGKCQIANVETGRRDAVGIKDSTGFAIEAVDQSRVLVIEIPEN
jgi:hypothetical protein